MSTHSLQNKQHNRMHSDFKIHIAEDATGLNFMMTTEQPYATPTLIFCFPPPQYMQAVTFNSLLLKKKIWECLTTSCRFIFRIEVYCQHMALPTYWQCIAPPIAPAKKITFSNKLSMSSPLKEHLYIAWLNADGCHYNWAATWEGYVRKDLNGPNQLQNTSVYLSFAPATWAA